MQTQVQSFYDNNTGTFSYVVADTKTQKALIIDPVLDFDMSSGAISYHSADQILAYIQANDYSVEWILETHAHADHLTSAQYLAKKLQARVAIGSGITRVQKTFSNVFALEETLATDGSQFDHCFEDGDSFSLGELSVTVMATPGHTNDSVTYLIGDAAFIGDTMFYPELGTARCDFPGGDAKMLYQSIQKILSLPKETRLFLCHDYPQAPREATCEVSIDAQRSGNIHVNDLCSEQDFIAFRTERDASLSVPKLIYPAIQVNIDAGHLPEVDEQKRSFIKMPIQVERS